MQMEGVGYPDQMPAPDKPYGNNTITRDGS